MKAIIATLVFSCSVAWVSLAAAETVKILVAGGEVAPSNMGDQIMLTLTLASSKDLSKFTRRQVGTDIDVLVNKNVVSSPHIMDPLLFFGKPLQIPIPANATRTESKETIDKLVSGTSILELRSRDGQ
ncbi:hypothetical protein CO666_14930 [Rhizobium chutanense]|uniref:Uncharacterized protein n=1 Tax=Rhizobium chutanense TaxID=2035448 RepID=A0A2A6JBV9_9HYPH|nr:hypothetical protein CO666_14930 [Rhizobium chutanense]